MDCWFAFGVTEAVYRVQLNEHAGLIVEVAICNPMVRSMQKGEIVIGRDHQNVPFCIQHQQPLIPFH